MVMFLHWIVSRSVVRHNKAPSPEITLVLGMTETQTGSNVWRVQLHETGGSFWQRLFGGSPGEFYEVSRDTVRKGLETLL